MVQRGSFLAALLALVTLLPLPASAASFRALVGNGGQAILQFSPDPPPVGKAHAIVTLSGFPATALAHTTVTFTTAMHSMSMAGPGGSAKSTANGRWEFDPYLGMADTWEIRVRFSGDVKGTAIYHVVVGKPAPQATDSNSSMAGIPGMAGSAPPSPAPTAKAASNAASGANMGSMPGMPNAPPAASAAGPSGAAMASMAASGDPGAWRSATYALIAILLVGAFVIVVRRDRRPLTIGIALGAGLLTVVLAAFDARFAPSPMDMTALSNVSGSAATPVTEVAMRGSDNDPLVFAPGSIAPYLVQDIVTRASGILGGFSAYAGDRVSAGQTLATLDSPDAHSRAQSAAADAAAQLAAAQSARIEADRQAPDRVVIARTDVASTQRDLIAARSDESAKAQRLRYWQDEIGREKSLLDAGAVSQQEYQDELAQAAAARADHSGALQKVGSLNEQLHASRTKATDAVASVEQMRAQAASASAQAERAQRDAETEATLASYTNVTSPSDGIVIKRLVDPGVYVAIGTPIARVAVIDRLRIQANVSQQDLPGIAVGTPVEAKLADGTVVRGQVTSVSPIADNATHTAAVEAVVPNSRRDLVPGGFVRVTLHARASRVKGGMNVPSAAVVGSGDDAAIWTDSGGGAHRVPVHVLSDDGTTATVAGNLQRGQRVVVEGAATLEEGQSITAARS